MSKNKVKEQNNKDKAPEDVKKQKVKKESLIKRIQNKFDYKEKKELSPLQRKKLKKKRIKWGIFGVIVLIIFINYLVNLGRVPSTDNSTISKISKETIATSIGATGTIEASSSKIVTSNLTGLTVKSVFVENGDIVNSGDPICEFDVTSIQKALNEQRQAEREEQERQDELREELEKSKKDADAIVNQRQKELDEANERLDNAKLKVDKAQKELDDYNNSTNTTTNTTVNNAISNAVTNIISNTIANATNTISNQTGVDMNEYAQLQQNLIDANSEYSQAQVDVARSEQELENAKQAADIDVNGIMTGINSVNGMSNTLSAINGLSSAGVNTSGLSSLASSMGISSYLTSNMTYEEMIANRIVKAPVSGTITNLSVVEDMTLTSSQVCLIEGADTFCVTSEIGEYDIPDIKEGMKVKIKTEATRDLELDGIVISVATTPTTSGMNSLSNLMSSSMFSSMMTGTTSSSGSGSTGGTSYTVKIDLLTQNDRLRLGMNAKMSIITDMKTNVLAVPYDAIETDDDGNKYIVTVADDFDIEKVAKEKKKEKMYKATVEADKSAIPNELLEGNTKKIIVKTGLEGTYNVEISSDEVYEGMNVIVNKSSVTNSIEALLQMMGAAAGT